MKKKVLTDLADFIQIQSVSTDPHRFDQMLEAVAFLKTKLQEMGFEVSEIISENKAPPLLIATKMVSSQAKTIGIYGHYDVQPEDPLDEWQTSPFELVVKKAKFFGRGVADNKGHIIQNLAAIAKLINEGSLENNLVFIFEGEEELGSIHFEEYVKKAKKILSTVDVFYLTDMGMHDKDTPQIFYGLRGLIYFELEIKTSRHDLHSGIYGNRVYNPIQVLSDLFVKMKDLKTGKILIPKFYDRVRQPNEKELKLLSRAAVSDENLQKEAGVDKVLTIDGLPSYLVTKILPSFDVHGVISGYTGFGSKTIIPSVSRAKFSFRLVEHQKSNEIGILVKKFIADNLPSGIKHKLKTLSQSDPFYMAIENPFIQKTGRIMTEYFGQQTLFNRSGGSVAAAEILARLYQKPIIPVGFTLPDSNIHSPNENYDEEMFWKGLEVLERIYRQI